MTRKKNFGQLWADLCAASAISAARFVRFLASDRGYRDLFKAAAVVMAVALIGLAQPGMELLKLDLETSAVRYRLEAAVGMQLDIIDCAKVGAQQADCAFAKYQIKTIESATDLLLQVLYWSFGISLALTGLAMWGFLTRCFSDLPGDGQSD